jgi:hypothetical protein
LEELLFPPDSGLGGIIPMSNYSSVVSDDLAATVIPTLNVTAMMHASYLESQNIRYYSIIVILMKLYNFPFILFGTALWLTHSFLAVTNTTTFEVTKGSSHIDYLHGTKTCDFPFSSVRIVLQAHLL